MAITQTVITSTTEAALADNEIFTSSGENAVTCIYLCNVTGAAATVTVWIKPTAGTQAIDLHLIYNAVNIPAGDTFVIDLEKLIIPDLYAISAISDTGSAITATVSTIGI